MVLRKRINVNLDHDEIMTADDVAKFLKVSVGAVRHWTREGKLRGYKMGSTGDWRYLKGDIIDFLMK